MEKVLKRITDEYNNFIEELKKQPAETIISCANEIVVKDNIRMYIENIVDGVYDFIYDPDIVLSYARSGNLLESLYELWNSKTIYQEYSDIGDLLYDYADSLSKGIEVI